MAINIIFWLSKAESEPKRRVTLCCSAASGRLWASSFITTDSFKTGQTELQIYDLVFVCVSKKPSDLTSPRETGLLLLLGTVKDTVYCFFCFTPGKENRFNKLHAFAGALQVVVVFTALRSMGGGSSRFDAM